MCTHQPEGHVDVFIKKILSCARLHPFYKRSMYFYLVLKTENNEDKYK